MRSGSRMLMMCVLAAASVGCTASETVYQICPGYTDDAGNILPSDVAVLPDGGVDILEPDTQEDVGSADTDAVPQGDPAGTACTSNDVCATGQCFCGDPATAQCTDAAKAAEVFGAKWTYVLAGGMCTTNCVPGSDGKCGQGARCVDATALVESPDPIGLCAAECVDYTDCRYLEGYVCWFNGIDGQSACLPANVAADMPCGNGKCDASANETKDTCPRDCP